MPVCPRDQEETGLLSGARVSLRAAPAALFMLTVIGSCSGGSGSVEESSSQDRLIPTVATVALSPLDVDDVCEVPSPYVIPGSDLLERDFPGAFEPFNPLVSEPDPPPPSVDAPDDANQYYAEAYPEVALTAASWRVEGETLRLTFDVVGDLESMSDEDLVGSDANDGLQFGVTTFDPAAEDPSRGLSLRAMMSLSGWQVLLDDPDAFSGAILDGSVAVAGGQVVIEVATDDLPASPPGEISYRASRTLDGDGELSLESECPSLIGP